MSRHSGPEGCETQPPPPGQRVGADCCGALKPKNSSMGVPTGLQPELSSALPPRDTQAAWRRSLPSSQTFSCVFTAFCRSLIYQLGSSYAWDVFRIMDVHTCWRIPQPVFMPEHEIAEQMLILILSSHANKKLCRNRLVYILSPTARHC